MPKGPRAADHACPFIDDDDPRCAKHFTLGRLDQAFALCLGGFARCPIYAQLRQAQSSPRPALTLPPKPLAFAPPARRVAS